LTIPVISLNSRKRFVITEPFRATQVSKKSQISLIEILVLGTLGFETTDKFAF